MRSKYGTYPEYHTSLDDLAFVSADGLAGGIGALAKAIVAVDSNATYRTTVLGEPQLGKRNLYPTLGTRQGNRSVRDLMNLLAYADGERDLLALAELLGVPIWDLVPIVRELSAHALLAECDANDGKAGT